MHHSMTNLFRVLGRGLVLAVITAATSAHAGGLAPQINTLSDATLSRSGRLLILGSGFGSPLGTSNVFINGLEAIATSWTDTEIHAYVPEVSTLGSVPVQVTTDQGSSNAMTLNVTLRQPGPDVRVRWRFQMDSRFPGGFMTLAPDGTIYASDLARLYALTPNGGLIWVAELAGARRPISLAADGTIYTVGNLIKAINPDGTLKWQFPDPFPGVAFIAGPNVGPDGNIYAGQSTFRGTALGPFSLDPDGNLRWSDPDSDLISSSGGSNSNIVFSPDKVFIGNVTDAGTAPILTAFDFNGSQLWSSVAADLNLVTGSFPTMHPTTGRIIIGWSSQAMQSLTPDGGVDWISVHPTSGNFMAMPGIDPAGVMYTASWLGTQLWSFNPDGSTRWALPSTGGILQSLNVPPDGSLILVGGRDNFGQPGWVRAYDTAAGAFMWQVDLPTELGIDQQIHSAQPTFTPDSQTAYFATILPGTPEYSYIYALDVSPDPGLPVRLGDVDGNGVVNVTDLLMLLSGWGPCPSPCSSCITDSNDDCTVNVTDLLIMLGNWG